MMASPPKEHDSDPQETQEWLDALEGVLCAEGPERAHFLLERLVDKARRSGAFLPYSANTAYLNTIPPALEEPMPGDPEMEYRIRSLIRWNALAMVVRANKGGEELGGHIASFQSAATLYDVGFDYFFRAPTPEHGGDVLYTQGHSAPGIYARAFLEGRLSEEQLAHFRREVGGKGLSSYPHPWLMPDFWQMPTVSMGLGPLMSIYQARFMKYLQNRGLAQTEGRKVWAFMGDGEMDEPESLGAISLAARENLDNLIFVVNCNLQRLDGPVRGNGKIIQELEADFRGAGWNVIKVIWGSPWDALIAKDTSGVLLQRMMEAVDGEYQSFKARDGAYVRQHFFGKYPELLRLVANMSDDEIWHLSRGGHDAFKVYNAYRAAVRHSGQPTVILAKTIKGYGMGEAGEGQNITHQQKKMGESALKQFRNRFKIPIDDAVIAAAPFYRPADDSPEIRYLQERRQSLGGYLPVRHSASAPLEIPPLEYFSPLLEASGERHLSTTMAFVRLLNLLIRDKTLSQRIVPIVPDESRTFGMEGMFRSLGIYSSVGQLYEPQDHDQLMYYRESVNGQILQEGINEAGAFSSWIAAATSYSTHGVTTLPFYIFYSMFGFQRIGDLAWAAGDMQCRGFLIGGTAGRTTLNGEGLQHQDGHSQVHASFIPNCISYDPTYAYELAVIIQDGLQRMFHAQENVFYYLTTMNENYAHPALPDGAREGILKGMYLLHEQAAPEGPCVQLLGSGTILREVEAAAQLLAADWGVSSNVWSCPSFNELAREGQNVLRHNRHHPAEPAQVPYVTQCLKDTRGPVIAATDYIKTFTEQIRAFVPRRFVTLGTDGFGRSDTRAQLRHFFEVDRYYVVEAALHALADEGVIPLSQVAEAQRKYALDSAKPNPLKV